MRFHYVAAAMFAAALASPALSESTAPVGDASFVRHAAISDMYEIEASQLAQTKAESADVKSFASRMIADHTKTSDQMKATLSSKSGMHAPTALDSLHKAQLSRLRAAKGANFDHLYTQQQIQAHNQAVLLFTNESQNGKDPDLKNFAAQTLPALQQHLSMAQQLSKGGATP